MELSSRRSQGGDFYSDSVVTCHGLADEGQGDDGAKNVIVQFADNANLVSSSNCSIVIDMTAPIANAGGNQTADVGSVVSFNATNSRDNTAIVSYLWTFGDGTAGNGMTANHTYSISGMYLVELTVQDVAGNNAGATVAVVIQMPQPWLLYAGAAGVAIAAVGAAAFLVKKRH